ncbi:xanthine dehydrogenase family protein subunit M [soil metagenome]
MIPAAFDYEQAQSLADALAAAAAEDTKVICGGQTLIPLLRFRLTQPRRVVGIGHLPALRGIRVADGVVRIGAATTYRELLDSQELRGAAPLILEVTSNIGDIQVRNLGTIGGALVHADPSADMPGAMLVLDASFHVQASGGSRAIKARDFFRGAFDTALKPGELLVAIELPVVPSGSGAAYEVFEQAASGYPLVGAAALVTRSGPRVTDARLAFTGLTDAPFLVAAVSALVGSKGETDVIARIAELSVQGIEANVDHHAGAEYRLHLASVAARRALTLAVARAM